MTGTGGVRDGCVMLWLRSLAHIDVAASLRPTVAAETNRDYEDVAASSKPIVAAG